MALIGLPFGFIGTIATPTSPKAVSIITLSRIDPSAMMTMAVAIFPLATGLELQSLGTRHHKLVTGAGNVDGFLGDASEGGIGGLKIQRNIFIDQFIAKFSLPGSNRNACGIVGGNPGRTHYQKGIGVDPAC